MHVDLQQLPTFPRTLLRAALAVLAGQQET